MTSVEGDLTGAVLWEPPADVLEWSRIGRFMSWLAETRDVRCDTYEDLWAWSVAEIEAFWAAVWDHFDVRSSVPYQQVLVERVMPGARWFEGARLNYAEHIVGDRHRADAVAVLGRSQTRDDVDLTFGELTDQVTRVRAGLEGLGVGPGDRVVGYVPNIPEALVAFLACASLGAVWASCACEFGERSVIDRFGQIEPKVLFAVSGYRYGDKHVDRRPQVAAIREAISSIEHVIHIPYGPDELDDTTAWADLMAASPAPLKFEQVPFDHPLYVLFSSGTTGLPKAIVHGHGGILLEHLKGHGLCWDLGPEDRLMWFTTTAWMMWNALASVLLLGSSIVMLDGNPMYPDLENQWRLAAETRATMLGLSPGFVMSCRKQGLHPATKYDLSALRQLCTAGSPLAPEGAAWIVDELPGVWLNNGSGGTDVCSAFVSGNLLVPVYAGEISAPCLGVRAVAYDEAGNEVVGDLGELVVTEPMPSMPVRFWNDPDGIRYRSTYFEEYPGVWRQGDWVRFSERLSCVITGRSDATLNRGGVRLGTSEFYAVVEDLPEVVDSLVVHLEADDGGNGELLLFVVLGGDSPLDEALDAQIRQALRDALSPRHAPDMIVAMPGVPRSLTGKKLELPVKKILQGSQPHTVASRDALADPSVLDHYSAYAATRPGTG